MCLADLSADMDLGWTAQRRPHRLLLSLAVGLFASTASGGSSVEVQIAEAAVSVESGAGSSQTTLPYFDKDPKPCADCHPRHLPAPTSRHAGMAIAACTDCHKPSRIDGGQCGSEQSKAWELAGTESKLCGACHVFGGSGRKHKPLAEGRCSDCHTVHGSDEKALLKKPTVEGLCYGCHKSYATEPVSHAPVASGECLTCHDPHAGRAEPLLIDRPDQLCTRCHDVDTLTRERVKHTAVKEGHCVGCHDSHGGKERGMVKGRGTNLCLPCHDANAPRHLASASGRALVDLTRKVVHKPLVKGDCQYCHTQKHSSREESLLARPAVESCYKCHPRFEEKRKYLHGAAKLGDCAVCHDPHSSDNAALIAEPKINDVCFRCHEDDATSQEWVHKPLKEQGCTACHDPHGSSEPNSLKGSLEGGQFCASCHEKVLANVTVPHKAIDRYGCTVCHDPHGGKSAGIRADIFTVCTACHPRQKNGEHVGSFGGVHKVLGGPDPKRPGKDFSCVSCHNPHGSSSPKILRTGKTVQQSCKACH